MVASKFLNPKNDVAFLRIFGTEKNKDILIHFINDVLKLSGDEAIQDVTFLSPIQEAEIAIKKQSIIDVLCKSEKGEQIIVEMQVSPQKGFQKRAFYYASKAYFRQLNKGKDIDGQLEQALEYVREGDTFVVTRLDRLARSTLHLCKIAEILKSKKVALKVIDQNIDTSDATGRLLFNMLGAIGQFETEIRAERQMDGISKAKKDGVKFGRKKSLTSEEIGNLKEKRSQGKKIKQLMAEYNISKASVYRYLSPEGQYRDYAQ